MQEKVDLDALEAKLLDQTMITMTVGQFLGSLLEFQKRIASITRTQRDYTEKPVVVRKVASLDKEVCPCGCIVL